MERFQPSQATFENALSLGLWEARRPVLLEDESKAIGRLHLPEALYQAMTLSPVIHLEVGAEERSLRIFNEYVVVPLAKSGRADELQVQLLSSVQSLNRRLGGALTNRVTQQIRSAFVNQEPQFEDHKLWIQSLLNEHYDPAYDHSDVGKQRPTAFRGNYEECRQWIYSQYV